MNAFSRCLKDRITDSRKDGRQAGFTQRPFAVLFVLTKCTSMGGASGILKTGC